MTSLQHSPNATVRALEEMRLSWQATPMRVWTTCGQTPFIPVLSQRAWVVFYGALDVRTGRELALPHPPPTGS